MIKEEEDYSLGNTSVSEEEIQMRAKLFEEGYVPLQDAKDSGKRVLMEDIEEAKWLIKTYYFGTRFLHLEAYNLCSVSCTWPEFCYHPTVPDYIYILEKMCTPGRSDPLYESYKHREFEEWVDKNRQVIARNAAQALEIDWIDIQNTT